MGNTDDKNRDEPAGEPRGDPAGDPEEILESQPKLAGKLRRLFKEIKNGEDRQGPSGGSTHRNNIPGGRIIGDFRILREIGSGGMGTVYEAEQLSLKRNVALKILAPHLDLSRRAVEKFHREAEAGGRQSHPGIVAVLAVGEAGGVHFIAQELVIGKGDLAARIETIRGRSRLPRGWFRATTRIAAAVADALSHSHALGVIHRDVKPSNILLTEDDSPKITDFGLARVEDALALSRSGEFAGTPFYMSPEQAMSRRSGIDARTDIFSLGVSLYEMITLKKPFDGKTSQEVLKKVILHEPVDPVRVNNRIPRDLSVICLKAMEKNPARRYQSMDEFAADLRRFLDAEPVLARPVGFFGRAIRRIRGHKLASFAAAASLAALASLIILATIVSNRQEEKKLFVSERFCPLKKAMEWPNIARRAEPLQWFREADPENPGGEMILALSDIPQKKLGSAREILQVCIKKCRTREDSDLESDAHYLLGLVIAGLATETRDKKKRADLIAGANSEFLAVGEFNPTRSLVLRSADPETLAGGDPISELEKIQLNRNHELLDLFLGLTAFQNLYLGGELVDFEKAIEKFEDVLDKRPDDIMALVFLGRVHYFVARFFNLLNRTESAVEYLNRALEHSGDEPYHMIHTTLGQISLLRGETEKARRYFNRAINLKIDRNRRSIQSAYAGIGWTFVRQRNFEKAEEFFKRALDKMPGDSHAVISQGELALFQGRPEEALEKAEDAQKRFSSGRKTKKTVMIASSYLLAARALIALGDYPRAFDKIEGLKQLAVFSPRDLSLAVFHLAVIPEETQRSRHLTALIADYSSSLSKMIGRDFPSVGFCPPLVLSADGVSLYLNGKYTDAVARFKTAREGRNRWRDETHRFYWTEDARDLYFEAMAFAAAAEEAGGDGALLDKAHSSFEAAEKLFGNNTPPVESEALIKKTRARAVEKLGQ
jgi:serine/threonine protein kinase/Flp pilus assembly protein TadD